MDKVTTSGSLPSIVAVGMALNAALDLYLVQWSCVTASNGLLLGNIQECLPEMLQF